MLKIIKESNGEMELVFLSQSRVAGKGFGLSKSLNYTKNSTLTLSNLSTVFELTEENGKTNNITCHNKGIDESIFYKMDDIISYACEMNSSVYDSFQYIIFIDDHHTKNPDLEKIDSSNINFVHKSEIRPCITDSLSGRGRIDAVYWQVSIFSVLFYIFILLLLVYYRNEQPLKSRRLVPYIALVSNFCFLIVDMTMNNFNHEWRTKNDCIVDLFTTNRLSVVISFLPFFVILRYFILINLNKRKELLYTKSKDQVEISRSAKLFLKFINFLTSNFCTIIFISLIYLVTLAIQSILYFQGNFDCNKVKSSRFYSTMTVLQQFSVYIPISILLVFDFFINIKAICSKCGIFKYYLTEDIHFFRLETIFVFFSTLAFGLGTAFGFARVTKQVAYFLLYYNLFIYQVLFVLGITIIRKFVNDRRKIADVEQGKITEIFDTKNDELFKMFVKFSESEFSSENVLIKRDIEKYRTSNQKPQLAKGIFALYLNGTDSIYQVNIAESLISEIHNSIENNNFPSDLFDRIEKEIDVNLKDTYGRFRFQREYLMLMKTVEFQTTQIN
eukprot:gene7841-12314_t